jgi:hypothetical protein
MNDFERCFTEHRGRLVSKWKHYLSIYDAHFSRYRGSDVHVLEIGVNHGGSLQLWRKYFGANARLFGVDINPHCMALEETGTKIFIGDQGDRAFLESLATRIPRIDILVDDGGHTMAQQIATFVVLFPRIAADGVYLCEDVCTSYWRRFGGGFRKRGSFIEYSKTLIDSLNAWHSEVPARLSVNEFTRSVRSITYYDSVVVIEKRPATKMVEITAGTPAVADYYPPKRGWKAVQRKVELAGKRLIGRG